MDGPDAGSRSKGDSGRRAFRWLGSICRHQAEGIAALAEKASPEGAALSAGAVAKTNSPGRAHPWDRVRNVVRAWWAWFAVALLLEFIGLRITGILAGAISFALYHMSPDFHPAVYALEPDFDSDSAEFRETMVGATGMPQVDGNRVQILNNGDEFYPAMLEAIESARLSITMEQYIFWDGEVGRRFAEAFAAKACSGIPVKLLVDAIGSATLGSEIFETLERGGCQLARFRPKPGAKLGMKTQIR